MVMQKHLEQYTMFTAHTSNQMHENGFQLQNKPTYQSYKLFNGLKFFSRVQISIVIKTGLLWHLKSPIFGRRKVI